MMYHIYIVNTILTILCPLFGVFSKLSLDVLAFLQVSFIQHLYCQQNTRDTTHGDHV